MTNLDLDGYERFVEAIHGHRPFRWQRRLVARLLEGKGWPDLLDLPTGVGKTSVLDAAVYALAATATENGVALPRRMVFVVDRRVIVDQTAEHADKLVAALGDPGGGHVREVGRDEVRTVARALSDRVGGDERRPLHSATLRGGLPRDGSWALRPDQATIMVSTVDQVGSRLLFNGYGVTDRMAPVHAGLLGTDTVFFLDEVHLSRPFAQTLRTVSQTRSGVAGPAPLTVVELSATPGGGDDEGDEVFALTNEDGEDWDPERSPELVRRLTAPRMARIVEAKGQDVAEAVAAAALKALSTLDGDTHAIVVNRVATARAVHRLVSQKRPDDEVLLVTGRMRPLDRDEVLRGYAHRLRAGRTRPGRSEVPPGRPRLVVVATQTIEAGADLDFDGMVTELAPIDSLRQRFGRVDRLGRAADADIAPRVVIVAPRAVLKAKDDDPVYGRASVTAHDWLRERFGDGEFDVSPANEVLANPPQPTLAPARSAPLLLPHHIELLAQTAPRPATQPPVDPWLHGVGQVERDVTVIWRADIAYPTEDPTEPLWDAMMPSNEAVLALAPPAPGEAMPVGIGAFRDWAASRGFTQVVRSGHGKPAELVSLTADRSRGPSLRPGDTIVVPTAWGGIGAGNWSPAERSEVTDRGLEAVLRQRGRVVIRVVQGSVPDDVGDVGELHRDDELVHDRLHAWLEEDAGWRDWFGDYGIEVPEKPAGVELHWISNAIGQGEARPVLAWSVRCESQLDALSGLSHVGSTGDGFDGSDAVHSFTAAGVPLGDHCDGVGALAREFAARAGLSQDLQDDLELAGRLHDLGKADPRFQLMLHGGWPGMWVPGQPLMAKSSWGGQGDPEVRRARVRSGYPARMRHEVASVALVQDVAEVRARAHDWDLVLYLVATHHGSCRPLAPAVADPEARSVVVEFEGQRLKASSAHALADLGAGVPDRYWRVQSCYGPWGAAFLETVLRLADHRRSQQEKGGSR